MSDVLLARGEFWNTIPPELQARIEGGAERIGRLRGAIGTSAKVREMPSVSIDCAAWVFGDDILVHSAANLWPTTRGGAAIGVAAAAGIAICTDEPIVRAVLVHEFSHCFMIATRIIEHLDSGRAGPLDLRGDPMDRSREDAMLASGSDWFGDEDAELLRWEDRRLREAISKEVVEHVNSGRLPATSPPPGSRGRAVVPPEWAAHIRLLRSKRAQ